MNLELKEVQILTICFAASTSYILGTEAPDVVEIAQTSSMHVVIGCMKWLIFVLAG